MFAFVKRWSEGTIMEAVYVYDNRMKVLSSHHFLGAGVEYTLTGVSQPALVSDLAIAALE